MNIKKEFGEKIKRMRKKKNLTQEQLAEMVNISVRNLSGIEIGQNFVKADTLEKIIAALDTTPEELFATEHLKSTQELINDINLAMKSIENDRKKLEYLYKIVKYLSNED